MEIRVGNNTGRDGSLAREHEGGPDSNSRWVVFHDEASWNVVMEDLKADPANPRRPTTFDESVLGGIFDGAAGCIVPTGPVGGVLHIFIPADIMAALRAHHASVVSLRAAVPQSSGCLKILDGAARTAIESLPARPECEPPLSFQAAVEDLLSLMSQPTTPARYIDGAYEVFDHLDKCLFVKVEKYPAPLTDDGVGMLQPSDLFLRYMAAFRAGDWPLVGVIEHAIRS